MKRIYPLEQKVDELIKAAKMLLERVTALELEKNDNDQRRSV